MIPWLLKAIGISETFTGRLDEVRWMWARPRVFWVGLILLLPVAVIVVLRQRRNLPHISPALRGLLSACRIGILLLLVVILGGPYLRLAEPVMQKPVLAWLTDRSASMDLPVGSYDGAQLVDLASAAGMMGTPGDEPAASVDAEVRRELLNLSRGELARRVIEHHRGSLMEPLKERFDLCLYSFARGLWPDMLNGEEPSNRVDEFTEEDRNDTALGSALEEAMARAAGRRLAGIVVLTDGRSTTGPDPVEVLQRHRAVTTNETGTPVWTVPVGSPEPLTDIALLDVLAPSQVARDDIGVVVATIGSHGFDDRPVSVRLLEGDEVLDEAELNLSGDKRQQAQLRFEAKEPGLRLLTIDVSPQAEEQVQSNNRLGLTINVDEERWRILYLEGYPDWDFRFLDHALRRDHGLEVATVMEASLRADGVKAENLWEAADLPQDAAGFSEYHVVILGDITPAQLPLRFQEQLATAVREEGLGLIVRAGPYAMPHAFADGPLATLLPIRVTSSDGAPEGSPSGVEAPAFAPFQMVVTASGSMHPAFSLYESATRNRGVWSRMPPFFWAACADEASPGATVLAETEVGGERRPLIAEHFAGAGRVLFIGTDTTFRWRRNIGDHLFYRFWGQAIRHIARSKKRSSENNWMEVYPPRTVAGQSVYIELYAVDGEGRPLTASEAAVHVGSGDWARTVPLYRSAQPGHFRGTWSTEKEGDFQFSYTDAYGSTITATARVVESGQELLRPDVDRDTLGSLAEGSGGGLLELDRVHQLLDQLQGETVTVQRTHEEELWDNWATLVALVMLFCADVFIRRMSGLT